MPCWIQICFQKIFSAILKNASSINVSICFTIEIKRRSRFASSNLFRFKWMMLLISWESDRNVNKHKITEIFFEMHKFLKFYHVIYQMKAKTILLLIMMKIFIFKSIQILGLLPYIEWRKEKKSTYQFFCVGRVRSDEKKL